jgi:hypothetical protein
MSITGKAATATVALNRVRTGVVDDVVLLGLRAAADVCAALEGEQAHDSVKRFCSTEDLTPDVDRAWPELPLLLTEMAAIRMNLQDIIDRLSEARIVDREIAADAEKIQDFFSRITFHLPIYAAICSRLEIEDADGGSA